MARRSNIEALPFEVRQHLLEMVRQGKNNTQIFAWLRKEKHPIRKSVVDRWRPKAEKRVRVDGIVERKLGNADGSFSFGAAEQAIAKNLTGGLLTLAEQKDSLDSKQLGKLSQTFGVLQTAEDRATRRKELAATKRAEAKAAKGDTELARCKAMFAAQSLLGAPDPKLAKRIKELENGNS